MAKCFDLVGYIEPCNAVRQKYTGRALLIVGRSGSETVSGSIVFSENGVNVTGIYGINRFDKAGGFVEEWVKSGGMALPVIIDAQNPFGVTIQGNTDSGRVMYKKTIPVSIQATRDCKAEEFIIGLQKGLFGSAIIVLESSGLDDPNGIIYNDIFGAYCPVYLDPASVTRNEYENGGAWTFNIVCDEPVPNVICTMPGLHTAIDSLNA